MTIAAIVLWMAMQGQANPCHNDPQLAYYPGWENQAVEIDGGCPKYDADGHMTTQGINVTSSEHVIEIRTKRETEEPEYLLDKQGYISTFRCKSGYEYVPVTCERVTREVWIDGVRWGVLKETEERPNVLP